MKTVTNIGVLGGGQLGRMLALEARRMGFHVVKWTGGDKSGAEQLADHIIAEPFDSPEALNEFLESSDAVTIEFENIPHALLESIDKKIFLTPPPKAVAICQNRNLEKSFLRDNGIPTAPFQVIESAEALAQAIESLTKDSILKTITDGYDGKGQAPINLGTSPDTAPQIWQEIGNKPCILEEKINLAGEFSVIVARHKDGSTATYPPIENQHTNHILDTSIFPARLPEDTLEEAKGIATKLTTLLEYIGILTTEFFITTEGEILVNELAPRPHNSGHLTIEAAHTSQFEQQLRIAAGLPLGSPETIRPAVMINLLGDLWPAPEQAPDWSAILAIPGVKLHLYGKKIAKPGRKMGHITITAKTQDLALERAKKVREILF